ncbi:1-acylglycerol-3-phosphate O-acyltransferase ABHD5 [Echinococcus granulosus]|uniref:Abhydrolase domain containing protein n=1 Tax=Echinococcus granulosus TaxID=6210 RepID=A0A068WRW3_ECHGR|nr:1-acylglycerol-3-phosphate O-acyltransferase ABHD5 [Echinococcus granulosus]CDS22855.1 abhydrolase domain containing protein [Echinococcus granulosus]
MTIPTSVTDNDLHDKSKDSRWHWCKWIPTSNTKLIQAEDKILQRCECDFEKFFLPVYDSSLYLRTVIARNFPKSKPIHSEYEQRVPLVLIHGFASGVGLWCKNFDTLSAFRRVYAFDLLGFGRSSRPPFPNTAEEVENKFVEDIEEWRKNIKLDKFILLGHSMGGFIAASYALSHPERIVHLVLIDPWGFIGQEENTTSFPSGVRGWVVKRLASFRALTTMRMIGPFGLNAMRKVRQDFGQVYFQTSASTNEPCEVNDDSHDFAHVSSWSAGKKRSVASKMGFSKASSFDSLSPYDSSVVYNYIYHINVRNPTGEDAFKNMSMLGWAVLPMLPRIRDLKADVPITFIYGGRSWVDFSSGLRTRDLRPDSYVDVMVIEDGGHHAYAEYADEFNNYVNTIAHLVDEGHVFHAGGEEAVQMAAASSYHPTSTFNETNSSEVSPSK